MRIGLDLDGTVDDFWNPYIKRFGHPKKDSEITKNVQRVLSKDRDFWLNLPVLRHIDFTPELYCTKRVSPKQWTRKWLVENGSPNRPIYQMYYQHGNKATMIKGRVDVFVDDSISNFIKLNLSGVPCLLIDQPDNQDWGPIGRIFTLTKEEIIDAYNLFIDTGMFDNFKNLL
jgi:hypothetical protein